MNNYIINFAVYSFAMVGFLLTLLFIYKKTITPVGSSVKKDFLKVENILKLSPVKTIYVIKAGDEKFLIAGDTANTTMLAKLENNQNTDLTDTNETVSKSVPLKVLERFNRR